MHFFCIFVYTFLAGRYLVLERNSVLCTVSLSAVVSKIFHFLYSHSQKARKGDILCTALFVNVELHEILYIFSFHLCRWKENMYKILEPILTNECSFVKIGSRIAPRVVWHLQKLYHKQVIIVILSENKLK